MHTQFNTFVLILAAFTYVFLGTLTINASVSTDPDVDAGLDMRLTYKWYCKQNVEAFKDNLAESELIKYPAEKHNATYNDSIPHDDFKGCFGNGIGMLDDLSKFSIRNFPTFCRVCC